MKPKNGSNLTKSQITKEYNPFLDKEGITKNNDNHGLLSNDENKRSKNLIYKCINYNFLIFKIYIVDINEANDKNFDFKNNIKRNEINNLMNIKRINNNCDKVEKECILKTQKELKEALDINDEVIHNL